MNAPDANVGIRLFIDTMILRRDASGMRPARTKPRRGTHAVVPSAYDLGRFYGGGPEGVRDRLSQEACQCRGSGRHILPHDGKKTIFTRTQALLKDQRRATKNERRYTQ